MLFFKKECVLILYEIMNLLHVYALHCCMLHLGNTDSSSLPFFLCFQLVLVLKETKIQSNSEESLSLMILSRRML